MLKQIAQVESASLEAFKLHVDVAPRDMVYW